MIFQSIDSFSNTNTAWKVSKYGIFSGPYFPAFQLNTEKYFVSLHIQSECKKHGPEKTSYLDTFHIVQTYWKFFVEVGENIVLNILNTWQCFFFVFMVSSDDLNGALTQCNSCDFFPKFLYNLYAATILRAQLPFKKVKKTIRPLLL